MVFSLSSSISTLWSSFLEAVAYHALKNHGKKSDLNLSLFHQLESFADLFHTFIYNIFFITDP